MSRSAFSGVTASGLIAIGTTCLVGSGAAQGPVTPGPDFSYDRGFLVAKATTLRQGEQYVAILMPGATGIAYGLTDRITFLGGTVPWTIFGGYLFGYGSARFAVAHSPGAHLALGAFVATAINDDASTVAGWPFVTATIGTESASVTGLAGVGSSTQIFEGSLDGRALLQGSAEARVAPGLKLIAETLYLGRGTNPLGGFGARFSGHGHLFELGVARTFGSGDQFLPWVAVAFRLGRR